MRPSILIVALLGGAASARAESGSNPAFADVTRYMGTVQKELGLRGAAVLVGRADGTILYRESFGDFTPATVVGIASATKWWTGATFEWLAERRRLDLDRAIGGYLDDVPTDKAAITIRQLLSHTSGLPKAGSAPYKGCATLEEAARFLLGLPLFAPPGTAFQYNGSGMQIAGRIAERVTGKPWAEIFQEALARPLRLEATTYGPTRNPVLGGSISTTLDEMGRFLEMLAGEGRYRGAAVLAPESVRDLERDVAGAAKDFRSVTGGPLRFAGYNAGNWCEEKAADGRCIRMSSYGANGTYPWIDRRRGIYGVFLANDNLYRDEPYFKAVRERVERIVDAAR